MKNMKTFRQFKKEALRDPEVRHEYQASELTYELTRRLVRKRLEEGITQTQLAQRLGTKQASIARFERGEGNPTVLFIQRIAQGLGADVDITLTEKSEVMK
jgi:predicted transcriptional regulator